MRVEIIRHLMRLNILFLVFINTLNPVKAFKVLSKLTRLRREAHRTHRITKLAFVDRRWFSAPNLPGWPSRAFNQFVKQQIIKYRDGNEYPFVMQTVFFGVTRACKLKCKHCSENIHGYQKEDSDLKTLTDIYDRLNDSGIPHIQFTGGEPIERYDDIVNLIRRYNGMDTWILTSGFELTEERASNLKEAGLTGVNISLDHWDTGKHNSFRGNCDSFRWVEKAVMSCLAQGLVVSLSLCATKEFTTRENLEKYIELCLSY